MKKCGFWIQWVRFRGFKPWYHRWCLQWRLPPSRKAFRSESTIKGYDWSIEIRNLSQKCHNLQLTLCHELFTTCFHEKPNSQELKSQIVTNFWPIRSAFILFIRCQQLILNSKSTIFFYEIAFFSQGQKIVCFLLNASAFFVYFDLNCNFWNHRKKSVFVGSELVVGIWWTFHVVV